MITNVHMICGNGWSLANGCLCELERVQIPGWLERFDESCEDK